MRLIRNLGLMFVLAICFGSCFKAPEFPAIPQIGFKKIEFADVAAPAVADTLKLTITFKDGDGDLGLDASENDYPYNDKFYYKFADNTFVTYETKRTVAGFDTLPAFVTPYNCTNWEVTTDPDTGQASDTLYFELNPNNNNIFVDFFIQENSADTTFTLFDWKEEFIYPNCYVNGFNGRFPVLSKDLSRPTAQEGTIRYAMPSVAWNIIFGIKFMKVRVTIQDRALHRSNTIMTEKFQLKAI